MQAPGALPALRGFAAAPRTHTIARLEERIHYTMARVARAALQARSEGRSCRLPSLNDDHEELIVEGDKHFVPFRADPKVPQFVLRRAREV